MKKVINIIVIVLFALSTFACSYSYADEAAKKAAIAVSKEWLALLDSSEFDKTWDEAAPIFKAAIKKADWGRQINAIYTPFGKNLSRELVSSTYAETLPGAPDGKYVVIQYKSSFENKKSAIETITPMLDKDGKWRVSGYYIK